MSLKYRIVFFVLGIFAIMLGMFLGTWGVTSSQQDDGLVINLAGRQRMLTQKMTKETMEYVHFALTKETAAAEKNLKAVKNTMAVFDATLRALRNSGQAPTTLDLNGPKADIPAPSDTVAKQLADVQRLWNGVQDDINKTLSQGSQDALQHLLSTDISLLKSMDKAVGTMQAEAESKVSTLLIIQILCISIAAAVVGLVLFSLQKNLITPLYRIRDYADEVARGILDTKLTGNFKMELSELKTAIIGMEDGLKVAMHEAHEKSDAAEQSAAQAKNSLAQAQEQEAKVSQLLDALGKAADNARGISTDVFAAVEELSATFDQVNGGVEIQRDRMTETATAMEEMTSTVIEVASNASSAAQSANDSKANAQTGAEGVSRAVASIQQIEERILRLKETMAQLGQQADNIGQIIGVINDIADQTNLLALNAAIEAARAGDAGRGFAVVADEVRKLAEKTMTATKEVGSAITQIQEHARENVDAVDQAANDIVKSTEAANESGRFMEEIVVIVDATAGQVESIAAASEEQSAASEEINEAVSEVTRVAGETAEGMREAAGALNQITGLVEELDTLIQDMAKGRDATGAQGAGGKLFEWTDALSVGLNAIDTQHRTLVDLINELHSAMKNRSADSVLFDVVRRLKEYTSTHFGFEEKLFAKYGYPETDDHIVYHRKFVAEIEKFEQDLTSGKAAVTMDVMRFLKNWLVEHIQGIDTQYVPFLKKHGVQ